MLCGDREPLGSASSPPPSFTGGTKARQAALEESTSDLAIRLHDSLLSFLPSSGLHPPRHHHGSERPDAARQRLKARGGPAEATRGSTRSRSERDTCSPRRLEKMRAAMKRKSADGGDKSAIGFAGPVAPLSRGQSGGLTRRRGDKGNNVGGAGHGAAHGSAERAVALRARPAPLHWSDPLHSSEWRRDALCKPVDVARCSTSWSGG